MLAVLYRFGSGSVTLREEHRLRVFENVVLGKILGPKREQVTGDWRKLRNEEFHELYSSPNAIQVMKSWRMKWHGFWLICWRKMHTRFWW
jgi:hypothetical protein